MRAADRGCNRPHRQGAGAARGGVSPGRGIEPGVHLLADRERKAARYSDTEPRGKGAKGRKRTERRGAGANDAAGRGPGRGGGAEDDGR